MQDIASKVCTPCRGGVPPLGGDEVAALHRDIPEWEVLDDGTWLRRRFAFADFAQALAFVTAIGIEAEAQGHHPDICFGWGYAAVSWQTHKIKGLHENDFIMAARCDRLYAGRAGR